MDRTVLTGATLLDGSGAPPVAGRAVVVEGGRIAAVVAERAAPAGTALRLDGLTLLPGLINCHVHLCFGGEADPAAALQRDSYATTVIKAVLRARHTVEAGVTTVRDLGGRDYAELSVRDAIRAGLIPGPRVLAAGPITADTQVRPDRRRGRRGVDLKIAGSGAGLITGIGGGTRPPRPANHLRALQREEPIISTRESPPPKPDVLVTMAKMFRGSAGTPPRVDPVRQEVLLSEYWEQLLVRVDFLDRRAAGFRFDDHPLDAGLPAQVRHGIERRLARLRELAAGVRGYAAAGRWSEAEQHYESAERVATDTEHWLARGRSGVTAQQAAQQRRQASLAGVAARRETSQKAKAAILKAIKPVALKQRRRHDRVSLSAIIRHLQNTDEFEGDIETAVRDLHPKTLLRYLHALGLK
jgi:hypothetical protein